MKKRNKYILKSMVLLSMIGLGISGFAFENQANASSKISNSVSRHATQFDGLNEDDWPAWVHVGDPIPTSSKAYGVPGPEYTVQVKGDSSKPAHLWVEDYPSDPNHSGDCYVWDMQANNITINQGETAPTDASAYDTKFEPDDQGVFFGFFKADTSKVDVNTPGKYPVTITANTSAPLNGFLPNGRPMYQNPSVETHVFVKKADNKGPANNGSQTGPNARGNNGVVKHSKVYAIHAINMYRNTNLTGKLRHYRKARRVTRPRFYVKKIVRTRKGAVRYFVKQLNKKRYGWISGNTKLVQNNYYQPRKKSVRFRILNPKGLNSYKRKGLTKKAKHFKYGSVLKAKRIVKDGLQTRFQLSNGTYVSGRKNFVLFK